MDTNLSQFTVCTIKASGRRQMSRCSGPAPLQTGCDNNLVCHYHNVSPVTVLSWFYTLIFYRFVWKITVAATIVLIIVMYARLYHVCLFLNLQLTFCATADMLGQRLSKGFRYCDIQVSVLKWPSTRVFLTQSNL